MPTESKKRPYRKRRRAEAEAETRRRITEATVKLHGTVGPRGASVSAIAREAGVQRATVYSHFPDDQSLFEACTAHFYELHPRPDPSDWEAVTDPAERLRTGLDQLYAWYEETEPTLTLTMIRDSALVPPAILARGAEYSGSLHAALMRGRKERGRARARVSAAIGHALAFPTWLSLARQQDLGRDDAVALMASLVQAAGSSR
jgi:AcrR family transcriptional regulator